MFHFLTRGQFQKSFLFSFFLSHHVFAGTAQFHTVGSHAIFPFVAAAAERFSYENLGRAPIVEVTGTGGGIKIFCLGVGKRYPDLVAASRPIYPQEQQFCRRNQVVSVLELKIGYDGIGLAKTKGSPGFPLTLAILRKALAKTIDGKPNPYVYWSDVSPHLPHQKIRIYGPPPTSGTRETFEYLVLKQFSDDLREDGVYVDMPEQEALMTQKLRLDPDAIGIFSYRFLSKNGKDLTVFKVNDALPTSKNIITRTYPLSRPLFLYVKVYPGMAPHVKTFVNFFMMPETSGEKGYLKEYGLIPLAAAQHAQEQQKALKFLKQYDN